MRNKQYDESKKPDAKKDEGCLMLEFPKRRPWTEQEDEIVKCHYPQEGTAIAERLPGRSVASCQIRAYILGVSVRSGHFSGARWTTEEDDILKTFYPSEGRAVLKRLPWRTGNAITTRATFLGIKRNYGPSMTCGSGVFFQYSRRCTLR